MGDGFAGEFRCGGVRAWRSGVRSTGQRRRARQNGSMSAPPQTPTRRQLFGWAVALVPLEVPNYLLVAFTALSLGLIPIWIGFPLVLGVVALVRKFTDLHRRRAGWILGTTIERPYRPRSDRGLIVRVFDILRD